MTTGSGAACPELVEGGTGSSIISTVAGSGITGISTGPGVGVGVGSTAGGEPSCPESAAVDEAALSNGSVGGLNISGCSATYSLYIRVKLSAPLVGGVSVLFSGKTGKLKFSGAGNS